MFQDVSGCSREIQKSSRIVYRGLQGFNGVQECFRGISRNLIVIQGVSWDAFEGLRGLQWFPAGLPGGFEGVSTYCITH